MTEVVDHAIYFTHPDGIQLEFCFEPATRASRQVSQPRRRMTLFQLDLVTHGIPADGNASVCSMRTQSTEEDFTWREYWTAKWR